MSQTYTDQNREEALELLRYNRNNVALTSAQTGIPERTLREWRRKQRIENRLPPNPSFPAAAANKVIVEDFEDTSQALQHVHERILQELVNIADSLPDLLATAPPYHQILALTQLIDRIEKLQTLIPQTGTPALRVEFVDPNGSVHDTPFWTRDPQED